MHRFFFIYLRHSKFSTRRHLFFSINALHLRYTSYFILRSILSLHACDNKNSTRARNTSLGREHVKIHSFISTSLGTRWPREDPEQVSARRSGTILLQNSKFLCGANSVSMELFQFTSTWLIVALTWTRVIAVVFPFGARDCQNRSAITIITSLVCTSFVISLTKLYSGGNVSRPVVCFPLRYNCAITRLRPIAFLPSTSRSLTPIAGYETDSVFEFVPCQEKIKPWGSAMYLYIALSTWLPLLFISIGNLLLIARMKKSRKIHNELTRKSRAAAIVDVAARADLTVTFASDNFRYRSSRMHNSSRTLLAVSIVHLILLLPLGIVETLELYWDVILIKHPDHAGENERYIHW